MTEFMTILVMRFISVMKLLKPLDKMGDRGLI